MIHEEYDKLHNILKEFEDKVHLQLRTYNGMLSIELTDLILVTELVDKLKKIPSVDALWNNKSILMFDNCLSIHANDTARNILMNLASLGIDNTCKKLEKLIDENGGAYYYINTLTGIVFDKKYKLFDCINIVNKEEIPITLREQWHEANNIEYGYSDRLFWSRNSAAMIYEDKFVIADTPQSFIEPINNDSVSNMISKKMNSIAILLPLLTFKPCYQLHHKCELDSSVLLGTDQGSSSALNELNVSSCNTVSFSPIELQNLVNQFLNLNQELQNHLWTVLLRFRAACTRHNQVDMLIELRIILESLLGTDRNDEPISHIISQRGAWLLGSTADERIEISKFLKKAYGLSSSAIHGSFKYKPSNYDFINNYMGYCIKIILNIMEKGKIPNSDEWNQITMGNR